MTISLKCHGCNVGNSLRTKSLNCPWMSPTILPSLMTLILVVILRTFALGGNAILPSFAELWPEVGENQIARASERESTEQKTVSTSWSTTSREHIAGPVALCSLATALSLRPLSVNFQRSGHGAATSRSEVSSKRIFLILASMHLRSSSVIGTCKAGHQ